MWEDLQETDGALANYAPTEPHTGTKNFEKEQGGESGNRTTIQAHSVPCAVLFFPGVQGRRTFENEARLHFIQ